MAHPDVSDSVSSIIAAFTSGLDVFKRVRERRGKQKGKKADKADKISGDELKLSQSLRQGPRDIRSEYERNYATFGERFAKGDSIAHTSLTSTLVKFNSGLVNIIATFLGRGKKEARLDYRSLTDLSEISRIEAMKAMSGLSGRLSQSSLIDIATCPGCGSTKHSKCSLIQPKNVEKATKPTVTNVQKGTRDQAKRHHRAQPKTIDGTKVARMNVKSSSQPKLAMVRPRTRRTTSSSSASSAATAKSTSSPSTAKTTPATSPLGSPRLDNRQFTPPPRYSLPGAYPTQPNSSQPFLPQPPSYHSSTPPPASRQPQVSIPIHTRQSRRPAHPPPHPPTNSHTEDEIHELPASSVTPHAVARRRVDRLTPSFYSFASDSTKLGEIPMHKWTVPYDYAAMERKNREAIESGQWPVESAAAPERKGRRFLGIFKKGGTAK